VLSGFHLLLCCWHPFTLLKTRSLMLDSVPISDGPLIQEIQLGEK